LSDECAPEKKVPEKENNKKKTLAKSGQTCSKKVAANSELLAGLEPV